VAETTVSYTCPRCGAPLTFAPGHDSITCGYCGTEFKASQLEKIFAPKERQAEKAAEEKKKSDAENALKNFSPEEAAALRVFRCASCGAELVCDENTMATECCYCGNPAMLPSRFTGMLRPDYVLPFKKTKQDAVKAFKNFYDGKLLLPSEFVAHNRMEAIQSVYVPFWLYDANVKLSASYMAECDDVTETKDKIITVTRYYRVRRAGRMKFRRIPVDGSSEMDDAYMESIEPFDYKALKRFSTAYLAGYLANKYDEDAKALAPRADARMESSAVKMLDKTVRGYDRHSEKEHSFERESGSAAYALVPVWILTTRYNGKPYTFMMNGQTGKLVGSLPIDYGKLVLYAAGIFAIVFVMAYNIMLRIIYA